MRQAPDSPDPAMLHRVRETPPGGQFDRDEGDSRNARDVRRESAWPARPPRSAEPEQSADAPPTAAHKDDRDVHGGHLGPDRFVTVPCPDAGLRTAHFDSVSGFLKRAGKHVAVRSVIVIPTEKAGIRRLCRT